MIRTEAKLIFGKKAVAFEIFITFLYTILFTVFDRTGRIDIGLYLLISAVEPDVKRGKTLVTFHSVGATPFARDKVIINVRGFVMTSAASLSNPGRMLSK